MAKTHLLNLIQKLIALADLSNKAGMPPIDEIAEWFEHQSEKGNRRDFIKQSMGAGSILLANNAFSTLVTNPPAHLKIAIIGAGIAGLNAGYTLHKNNFTHNFSIYEASGRIGGRIYTDKLNGNNATTELGAEFIDCNHDDMLCLANELGIEKIDTQKDTLVSDLFVIDGKKYHIKDAIKSFQNIRQKIATDAKAQGKNYFDLDYTSLKEYLSSLETDAWFLKGLSLAYTGEYGLETEVQSSLNFIELIGEQEQGTFDIFGKSDERFKLKGGNHQICEKIAKKFPNKIHYNHALQHIRNKNKGFLLKFSNQSEEVFADFVIMTIPFTILKNIEGINTLSGMSKEKLNCIQGLGYGTNAKCFLEFKERVWRKHGYNGAFYADDLQNGWDSFLLQNQNQGKSIFTIFLGGENGAEVTSKSGESYLPKIEEAFSGATANYSGYTNQFNWSKYPFSKGSYQCLKTGQRITILKHIDTPLGNLLFAGEHCSKEFGGFMNGGAETGRIAAERIIKKVLNRR